MGISVHVEFSYNTNTIASSLVGSNPGDAISHTIQTPTHSMAPAQGWHAQFQFNYYPGWRNTATSIHTTQTPLQADENSTGKEPSKQPIQGMAPHNSSLAHRACDFGTFVRISSHHHTMYNIAPPMVWAPDSHRACGFTSRKRCASCCKL